MGKYISCGNCDKRYFKILLLFFLINTIVVILTLTFIYITIVYLRFVTGVSLLKPLLTYIGMALCFIPDLILKKKSQNKKDPETTEINNNNKKKGFIEYIYNDLSDKIEGRDYIHIGFISLLLLLIDFIKIYLEKKENCEDAQYYFTELPFLLIISIYIYKINFYKHQYLSIIILTFFGIIQYIIKIVYYYQSTSNFKDIIIDLFLQIVMGLGEAIFFSYVKGLMQFKFLSPYKVCYIFGIINGIIILIIYFVVSEFKCNKVSLLCSVEYKGAFYFDNIYAVITGYNFWQIILLVLFSICFGAFKLLVNVIINYYSVCHIFLFLQNKGIADSISLEINKKINTIFQIIIQICYAINLFFSLVFLEMVELNFCGLNVNLKKNIQQRVSKESSLTIKDNEESEQNDEDEQEDNNYQNVSQD